MLESERVRVDECVCVREWVRESVSERVREVAKNKFHGILVWQKTSIKSFGDEKRKPSCQNCSSKFVASLYDDPPFMQFTRN